MLNWHTFGYIHINILLGGSGCHSVDAGRNLGDIPTLQGTNISHLRNRKIIDSKSVLGRDMFVPRRVSPFKMMRNNSNNKKVSTSFWVNLHEAHNLTFVTFQHKYRQLTKLQALLLKRPHMCGLFVGLFVFLDTMFPHLLCCMATRSHQWRNNTCWWKGAFLLLKTSWLWRTVMNNFDHLGSRGKQICIDTP